MALKAPKKKTIEAEAGLIPAAGYIRMSRDMQEDSPERQRREITRLAEREGCCIVEWYVDEGMTGTESRKRKGFQQMLADAKAGKFQAILLAEQSRMSREDPLDAMEHWRRLRDAGVAVYTCQRGKVDFSNIGGLIVTIVDAHAAHDESRKLAERSVSGKRAKLAKGERVNGSKPFGFDREFLDEQGKVITRAAWNKNFHKPPGWKVRLVPTDNAEAITVVRMIFDKFCAGATIGSIVRDLNRGPIRHMKRIAWRSDSVWSILQNPAYCGDMVVGRHGTTGRFVTISTTGEPIVVRDAHPAIITREQFDRTQALIAKRPKATSKRNISYLLTGLIRCGTCGERCMGHAESKKRSSRRQYIYYLCRSYSQFYSKDFCKTPFHVTADRLERLVLAVVKDALGSSQSRKAIGDAIKRRSRGAPEKTVLTLEGKLKTLNEQITKGTRNLALADPADVPGVKALLAGWREEAANTEQQLSAVTNTRKLAPEAQRVIDGLSGMIANLEQADKGRLAQALTATIKVIRASRRASPDGMYMHTHGHIEFQPGLGIERVEFDVRDATPSAHWPKIADYLRKAFPRPVRVVELSRHFGDKLANTQRHVERAIKRGVAIKNPHGRGYLAKL